MSFFESKPASSLKLERKGFRKTYYLSQTALFPVNILPAFYFSELVTIKDSVIDYTIKEVIFMLSGVKSKAS